MNNTVKIKCPYCGFEQSEICEYKDNGCLMATRCCNQDDCGHPFVVRPNFHVIAEVFGMRESLSGAEYPEYHSTLRGDKAANAEPLRKFDIGVNCQGVTELVEDICVDDLARAKELALQDYPAGALVADWTEWVLVNDEWVDVAEYRGASYGED